MLSSEQLFKYGDEPISILKGANDLVVAGYASVEVVDKQGDVITKEALNFVLASNPGMDGGTSPATVAARTIACHVSARTGPSPCRRT